MAVNIADCIFYYESLRHEVAVIGRVPRCVERYRHVRHYSATAVYRAVFVESGKPQTVGHRLAQAVGMHQLARVKAFLYVKGIIVKVAFYIGFLDASTRRGVVLCHGEAYHGAVGEGEWALHQSFAESAASYYRASVMILYGTRQNFACRGRVLIHKYYYPAIAEVAVARSTVGMARSVGPVGIYYHITLVKEVCRDLLGGVEIAASVALEVNDEIFHPFLFELFHRFLKLLWSLFGEARYTYVARGGIGHVACVDAVDGDVGACYREIDQVRHIVAQYLYVDFGAFGSAQTPHYIGIFHFHTGDDGIVHFDYSVAGENAHTLRRPPRYGRNNI